MMHLQKNAILQGGKYKIERLLGQGGFGNTYSGYNTTFDERVAIKEFFMQGVNKRDDYSGVVSVSLAENAQQFEEQREKFKKEALRIRKLNNPHIIKVHDLFEENGTVYYVMDFVDGESLAERLKRTGKPMSVREVEMILPQMLDALKTVHEASIWHLDLKPANIMIDNSGNVTLIDFGASKQLNLKKGGATTSTAISYTNGYAPREQMEQNYDKFGPWTDFYSLGATLYTLLSNKRPSLPTDIDDDVTEDKHIALPLPSDVINTTIHGLILWMMSTNRNLRPQCVEDILTKLDEKENVVQDSIDEETLVATPKERKESIGDNQEKIITKESHSHSIQNKPDNPKSKIRVYLVCGFIGILIVGAISAWIYSVQQQPTNPMEIVEEKKDSIPNVLDVNNFPVKSTLGKYSYTGPINASEQPHGFGEAIFTDGRKYKGYFIKGVFSGENSYFRYPNGDVFEGTFKDNSFYEGKYTISEDGSYFIGTFKNGQPDKGTWYDKNNKVITD
jgi:serine/threonine-protein kinase